MTAFLEIHRHMAMRTASYKICDNIRWNYNSGGNQDLGVLGKRKIKPKKYTCKYSDNYADKRDNLTKYYFLHFRLISIR